MEKNANISLTSHDIQMYNRGLLSERAKSLGLSLTDLGEVMRTKSYNLVDEWSTIQDEQYHPEFESSLPGLSGSLF